MALALALVLVRVFPFTPALVLAQAPRSRRRQKKNRHLTFNQHQNNEPNLKIRLLEGHLGMGFSSPDLTNLNNPAVFLGGLASTKRQCMQGKMP